MLLLAGAAGAAPPKPAAATAPGAAALVSADGLKVLSGALKQPIYWAGSAPAATTYKLTRLKNASVYVRYLPRGTVAGSRSPYLTIGTYPLRDAFGGAAATDPAKPHLTVGSYPQRNPYATTLSAETKAGSTVILVKGGTAFYSSASPGNVYVAFKGIDVLIEVFDPDPAIAQDLVRAGHVQRVR